MSDNFEKNLDAFMESQQIFNVRPVDGRSGLEGTVVTNRSWGEYQEALGMKPEALKEATVLNLGSGGSNIGETLEKLKTNCKLIDLDLKYDPIGNLFDTLFALSDPLYLKLFNPSEKMKRKFVEFKRRVSGTDGRTFIQGNAKNLPFPDGKFDYVLGLRSTYQMPLEVKENVYRELMRVGRILHLGPVFEDDYSILIKLAQEQHFEIVACLPMPTLKKLPFMFSSKEDYDRYISNTIESDRISIPPKDDSRIFTILGFHRHLGGNNGNTIVLRKHSTNTTK